MTLGPLEYIAFGMQNDHGLEQILPVLSTIEETGALRVLDLVCVNTDATGAAIIEEVGELRADNEADRVWPTQRVPGLLTVEDIQMLAKALPADASAVVVLLEHLWAQTLTTAVQRAGGVLYTGGLISPEALTQLDAPLAVAEAETAS